MDFDFTPTPHAEAVALLTGKPVVSKAVFKRLLPELRARAFTVAGVSSVNALQRIRDAVASVPLGAAGGQTWDQAKRQIVDELDPYLGDGSDFRATLVLRTNGFQAFSASIHDAGMADEDTTHFQYLHGECEVPTPSHLALNGVILPKDDPFWDTHTGPWGHLGCMCYKRPMNEDQVADEKADDAKRNPEDRNVIEGPALKQIHHGDIIRGGVHYNVDYDGPDNAGFKWSPGDFKIPLKDLEAKYDPEVWSGFQTWAQGTALDGQHSVWDWLSDTSAKSPPAPAKPMLPALEFKTAKEAVKWMDANYHPDKLGLSAAERSELVTYQQSSYSLNGALFKGRQLSGGQLAEIKHLDAALAKAKLPQPAIVWRGMKGAHWDAAAVGDVVAQPGYLSTALAEKTAGAFQEGALLKIKLPAGARALYMDDLDGEHGHEAELLLARNSKLRLLSKVKQGNVWMLELELIQ